MKTRKTVIAVLSAVLLISAALIVGCISEFEGAAIKKAEEDNFVVPKGKGLIKIKINDGRARTIMPSAIKEDLYYTFFFQDDVSSPVVRYPASGAESYSHVVAGIPLAPGTYTVNMSVYSDSAGTKIISAWSSPVGTTYIVDATHTPNISATFVCNAASGVDGKFNYYLDIEPTPAISNTQITSISYGTKELAIYDSTGNTLAVLHDENDDPVINPIDLSTDSFNQGDIFLDAGQYFVHVTLEASHCQDRVLKEVIYIYQNLPTNYGTSDTPISVPRPVQKEFIVRFISDYKPSSSTTINGTWEEDNPSDPDGSGKVDKTIQNAQNVQTASLPFGLGAETDDFNFTNWYYDNNTFANVFYNSSTKIFRDTTVYAKWTVKSGVTITINFAIPADGGGIIDVYYNGSPADVLNDFFNYNDILGGKVLKFTANLYNAVWDLDDYTLTPEGDGSVIISGTNLTLLNRLASGVHRINVRGYADVGLTDRQGTWIEFTVNNN